MGPVLNPLLKAVIPSALAGFVPYLSCQGTSSEDDMSHCLRIFQENTQRYKDQLEEFRCSVATAPKLKPICSEETVLRTLHQYYRQYHPFSLGTCSWKPAPLPPPGPKSRAWEACRAATKSTGCSTAPNPQASVRKRERSISKEPGGGRRRRVGERGLGTKTPGQSSQMGRHQLLSQSVLLFSCLLCARCLISLAV